MKRELRWLFAGSIICGGALLVDRGAAGGDKGPWQPILTKPIYEELVKREVDIIREQLAGTPKEAALNRAKFGAVLIAALTMSVKDGVAADELRGTRETAIRLADALQKKDLGRAKKVAAALPNAKENPTAKAGDINWGGYLDKPDLMDHYRPKAKGGDGMHPDLQSNIKFKGALNGVEEKIRNLGMKELTPANLKKEAKELELLSYRSAVVGSLTYFHGPTVKKGKQDPQEWRNLSVLMRDQSVNLAAAVDKGDTAAVLKAGSNLDSTCSRCHTDFRN